MIRSLMLLTAVIAGGWLSSGLLLPAGAQITTTTGGTTTGITTGTTTSPRILNPSSNLPASPPVYAGPNLPSSSSPVSGGVYSGQGGNLNPASGSYATGTYSGVQPSVTTAPTTGTTTLTPSNTLTPSTNQVGTPASGVGSTTTQP